jgi:hypothetical protein
MHCHINFLFRLSKHEGHARVVVFDIHWHNTDFRDPNDECIPLALAAVPKPCEAHASQSHA